jgi:hypothetical protein
MNIQSSELIKPDIYQKQHTAPSQLKQCLNKLKKNYNQQLDLIKMSFMKYKMNPDNHKFRKMFERNVSELEKLQVTATSLSNKMGSSNKKLSCTSKALEKAITQAKSQHDSHIEQIAEKHDEGTAFSQQLDDDTYEYNYNTAYLITLIFGGLYGIYFAASMRSPSVVVPTK